MLGNEFGEFLLTGRPTPTVGEAAGEALDLAARHDDASLLALQAARAALPGAVLAAQQPVSQEEQRPAGQEMQHGLAQERHERRHGPAACPRAATTGCTGLATLAAMEARPLIRVASTRSGRYRRAPECSAAPPAAVGYRSSARHRSSSAGSGSPIRARSRRRAARDRNRGRARP